MTAYSKDKHLNFLTVALILLAGVITFCGEPVAAAFLGAVILRLFIKAQFPQS